MKKLSNIDWNKVERFLGSLKFAVVIILCFATAMIIGTFLESYYGTDFANRTVYKTTAFMLIQFGMLMSIIFAAFLRLPPKKRLYGFYTIHAGLIIVGVGSMITYIAGVDGSITLAPNEPSRQVILNKDVLKITYPEEGKQVTSDLPYTAFTTKIGDEYQGINVMEYLPFAEGKFVWTPSINKYPPEAPIHSSKYFFKNPFAEEEILLTLHPESSGEFQSTMNMGPLTFNYMPEKLSDCFEKPSASGIIIWNSDNGECFVPEEKGFPVKETSAKNRFLVFPLKDKLLTFFPDFSPYPVDSSFQTDQKSIIRTFSKRIFEQKPNLFLFGKKLAFYSKEDKKWIVQNIELKGKSVALPWMGAEISLLEHQENMVPFHLPVATIPIQKNGAIIKGDIRALRLEIMGKEYWATNYSPLSLLIGGKKVIIEVTKENLTLPFEIALSNFKMDKDPGTNNPASYESFVKLFDDGKMTDHHVYMNNPMKHSGFTFYQASYSQDSGGNYNTTLAVNVDQGRPLKYLGSLMLVFGGIWHYNLNKKKKKKETVA
ncbi:MAG: cytochrome c biogenesis protein ResB [Rhizobacter sp.]|nr:cytochrome c biogenesis protein ResB [Bacteriovorax sp.]